MKLSTKSDYGVRALIELALSGDGAPVQRAEIASRQRIPESYLDHLLAQLRRDGFVRSVRGPGGGHLLTREPEEMCLLHVIESLEGSVASRWQTSPSACATGAAVRQPTTRSSTTARSKRATRVNHEGGYGMQTAIADSVLDLVGATPLVRLERVTPDGCAEVLGKLEARNPAGSVKDRIALRMVESAEREGLIHPGDTLVEPTSGNTGIGLAMVCARKGYQLVLTMPEDMSVERRRLLERFGAELRLTPAIEGMTGAVYAAQQVSEEHGYFMPQQFDNLANPRIHRETTGPEILEATGGALDAFVAGVGTGGSITGVGEVLREAVADVRIVAVEPSRSPVLQGGRAGLHGIQGIGASFVPGVLNREIYDEVISVRDEDAYAMTERLSREDGLLVGISAGSNVWAAIEVGKRLGPDCRVVTMLCDTGERYLSVALS